MIALGVDVGGTNLRVGVVNSNGELLLSLKEPTPSQSETLLQVLTSLTKKIQEEVKEPLQGLGLGWPGIVLRKEGRVLETPNIKGFQDFPLREEIQKRTGLKCELENDANCAGLAEQKFGAARDFQNFILLTFGTGIGGALFANGQLIRGRSGLAGEIGHMCLKPNGIECSCGSRGCFEKYVSAKALELRAQEHWKKFISAREVLEMAESGDSQAQSFLKDYVDDLATGLHSLTNIFDPEAFVFSGGLFTTGGGPILKELQKRLSNEGFQSMKKSMLLKASTLEGKAGIIGAASLMLPETLN